MPAVFDSSALLAYFADEKGGSTVEELLGQPGGAVSTVNLAEVATRLIELGAGREEVAATTDALPLHSHPLSRSQALSVGLLRPLTRSLGLSLGDRACLALAIELGVEVVTADRAWASLELGIHIRVIR